MRTLKLWSAPLMCTLKRELSLRKALAVHYTQRAKRSDHAAGPTKPSFTTLCSRIAPEFHLTSNQLAVTQRVVPPKHHHHQSISTQGTAISLHSLPSIDQLIAPLTKMAIASSQMLARAILRVAPAQRQMVARRGFQTTRAQLSSPYHYPEGPYTNLPFNTKTKFFAFRYWGFMATGFGLPFGIAGASIFTSLVLGDSRRKRVRMLIELGVQLGRLTARGRRFAVGRER